jgi:hypothetical protein
MSLENIQQVAAEIANEIADGDPVMGAAEFNIDTIVEIITAIIAAIDNCQPEESKQVELIGRLSRGGTGSLVARWRLNRIIRNEIGGGGNKKLRRRISQKLRQVGRNANTVASCVGTIY